MGKEPSDIQIHLTKISIDVAGSEHEYICVADTRIRDGARLICTIKVQNGEHKSFGMITE
ncbi:hypothetical protein C0068_11045 [Zhongshania marina]|uniref:Uncharacterized protein n=1 Tax=Zhongshania marina TaxID=2304603 RepID=A0A2S4HF43_9GAMM|nr:hypothetical protein C0068_11045 [Marortus luteolus]